MIKIDKVRELIDSEGIDALLVMSDYNRRYLSGFTGSSGAVIITKDAKYLVSDFRYNAQAQEQAKDFEFILRKLPCLISSFSFWKRRT